MEGSSQEDLPHFGIIVGVWAPQGQKFDISMKKGEPDKIFIKGFFRGGQQPTERSDQYYNVLL